MRKLILILPLASSPPVFAADCGEIEAQAQRFGAHIPTHISGRNVVGKGRLQFYSAPSESCKQPGIYILPRERVDTYLEYKDFTYVMYINLKTGADAEGWVLSSRLKENGQGIGPKQ